MKQLILFCCLFACLFIYAHVNNSRSINYDKNINSTQELDSLSINRGSELFSSQCYSCHSTYISHAYDTVGWTSILSRMTVNAGLDSTQSLDLTNFIFDRLSKTDTSFVTRTIGGYRQW